MPSRLALMRQQRLDKLTKLRELGFDGYPARGQKTHNTAQVTTDFEQLEGQNVTVCGRIMSRREHGQLLFIDLADASGSVQLYLRAEDMLESNPTQNALSFQQLNLLDTGDIISATGIVTKTKSGQISVQPTQVRLLTKALRPMPDNWEGIKDPEVAFRRRYVDFTVNPARRQLFERKAQFWKANRDFMAKQGFIEVETPVLEFVTGGADARPFITHMNALDQDFFLRISTELYQKRLIGGGFEKVFTIGPNFRNEGLSDEHLPEYYQIEWYWAYADYRDNMAMIEEMFRYIADTVYGKRVFTKNEHTFDLGAKWEEISYPDVIRETFGVDIFESLDEDFAKILKEHGIKLDGAVNRQRMIDNVWKIIRKKISGPAFLVNEPKFMSPLAKSKPEDPQLTERFHIIIAGSELGNGYSELNDPIDQLERFQEQQAARESGDDEAQMLDIDFVEMLEYGMPPTSGFGMSERVFWFLENITAREGTIFPTLRHKMEETTKEIYGIKDKKTPSHSENTIASSDKTSATLPSRATSLSLLKSHVQSEALRHHSHMVAAAMEAYARQLGEDAELWYAAGLLHDIDWEEFPDEHPNKAITEWLNDYPIELRQAVAAHAPERTGKEPETLIEKYLYACDELSGIMHATSLMRPNGFADMEVKSVKKKLKDKSFAANVNRDDIHRGAELIGTPLEDHIAFLINVFSH